MGQLHYYTLVGGGFAWVSYTYTHWLVVGLHGSVTPLHTGWFWVCMGHLHHYTLVGGGFAWDVYH